MKTFSVATLGCKVNQFESEALMASLEQRGYQSVLFREGPDITVINTCTVTHRADFQSRQMIRRAFRFNPKSLIIVTGCYSQLAPEEMGRIEGVHYILGNSEKRQIPDFLSLMEGGQFPRIQVSDIQKEIFFSDLPISSFHRHTRAFLKIQDGCNASCSYCIVPRARGPSRSLLPEKVYENLRVLKAKGFKEVVLTGIHIGSYGLDLIPPMTLEKLIQQLEREETPQRIRISSIEPMDFTEGLVSLFSKSKKICPHLHIPIQSGDDEVLRGMNRDYHPSFISDLILDLHRRIPNLSIGADLIVGFPGETEERFESTYRLIESLPLSYLHVFPFSKRKGTLASRLMHQVDEKTIKRRAEAMRGLGEQKRLAFYRRSIGQTLDVLLEDRKDEKTGKWKGFSRNYIPVLIANGHKSKGDSDWINQEWKVKVTELTEKGMMGRILERSCG